MLKFALFGGREREALMGSGILGLIVYVAIIAASFSIGSRKGRPVLGILLGIFLWLLGLIIIAVIPAKRTSYW
jgi:hypothetical protein